MSLRRRAARRWAATTIVASAVACSRGETGGTTEEPASTRASESALQCGTSRTLTGNGIGTLTVGSRLDALRARCEVVADTTEPRGPEGMPERRLSVRVDSTEVVAIVANDSVQRIVIDSPALHTASGLGVGSMVAELRPHDPRVVAGEGNVAVVLPGECGMSFLLDLRQSGETPTPGTLADSVRVRRVLVFGCPVDRQR